MKFGYVVRSNIEVLGIGLDIDFMSICATFESAREEYWELGSRFCPKYWSHVSVEKVHSDKPIPDADFNTTYSSWFGLVKRNVTLETWLLR